MAYYRGYPLEISSEAEKLNAGLSVALPEDFEMPVEWQQHLQTDDEQFTMREESLAKGRMLGQELHSWIDGLVGQFYQLRESCVVETDTEVSLPLCSDVAWSSLAPDPKSDVDALLK